MTGPFILKHIQSKLYNVEATLQCLDAEEANCQNEIEEAEKTVTEKEKRIKEIRHTRLFWNGCKRAYESLLKECSEPK